MHRRFPHLYTKQFTNQAQNLDLKQVLQICDVVVVKRKAFDQGTWHEL